LRPSHFPLAGTLGTQRKGDDHPIKGRYLVTIIEGTVMPNARDIKSQAQAIVDGLPDGADWDDVMYEIYVRQAIEAGDRDVETGRTLAENEVRARLAERVKRRA
jgi:hypothetical protein